MDLSGLSLHQINAGLLESGIGLIGYLPEIPAQIGTIEPGSPADLAGLRSGDRILAIDDEPITGWQDLVELVQTRPGKSARFEIMREGEARFVSIIPARIEQDGQVFGRIGIRPAPIELPEGVLVHVGYGPLEGFGRSVENVWLMSSVTLKMLWKILRLEVSAKNISGPLTIAQYAGQTVRVGIDRFLLFLAVVSISLGVINLLPIPLLDGGHLVYYAIELITGGPVSREVMMWGQQIGIVALFGLMSLAFYNDIVRLFG
jgi:regulator of sigma E protease